MFGGSKYGPRMDYSQPIYHDRWAAILYSIQVVVIVVVCIYLWASQMSDANVGSSKLNFTGVFVTLFVCMLAGTICGLVWLEVIKRWASKIIKFMLFANIGLWATVGIIGIATAQITLAIVGILFAVVFGLYAWCVWPRIPFASVLLSISSTIVQTYPGTIYISLAVIVFNILWIFIWFSTFVAYLVVSDNSDQDRNGFVDFLLLVSFYWGLQVNTNVSHTTTCGVAATWFFSSNSQISNPSKAAFQRTMTTSFGSVALGSLLVAVLEALRAMVRQAANSRNQIATCLVLCVLGCIESLIRFFNTYAFAHVAIYGTSYCDSGRATWDLFKSRGIQALINDDLSGLALVCGAFISLLVCAGVGCLGFAFYSSGGEWYPEIPILLVVAGAIIGYVFCIGVLMVIRSSVVTLFVCYAEAPATMVNNRPNEYQQIAVAKAEWGSVYEVYGTNTSSSTNQQQLVTTEPF